MAFGNAWVETDPDGSVITVSQLDNSDRLIKAAVRERLEGDPAIPDLTGLIEVGSFSAAPKPRKGAARIYVDTAANILAFTATKREDGRLAVASDTGILYHVATAAVVPVKIAAGDVVSGALTVTQLTITTAISKVIPGATSLSLRNNADSADNLIITDAGVATFRNNVTIGSATTTLDVFISRPAGFTGGLNFLTAGSARWGIYVTEAAETGADAGSNFRIRARTDGGVLIDDPISIVRAAGGAITLSRALTLTNVTIQATSALITLDGVAGTVPSGGNGIAANVGNITVGARGSVAIQIDNDNNQTTTSFNVNKDNSGAVVISFREDNLFAFGSAVDTTVGFKISATPAEIMAFSCVGYSLTGASSANMINLTGTWNTSASPTALHLNITNTGSGANALLMDLQASTVSQFKVSKAGNVTLAGNLIFTTAASRVVPGITSFTVRNNANTLDNLSIADAGLVTVRNGLIVGIDGVGDITLGGGTARLLFSAAVGKIVAGATSLSFRNSIDTLDNLHVTDLGIVTLRHKLVITPIVGDKGIVIQQATQTTDQPVLVLNQSWNAGAITFNAITVDVVNLASAAGSNYMKFTADGPTMFTVRIDGRVDTAAFYAVDAVQVVSNRVTGYTNAMTGTKNRATAYDTGTITHVQLAERMGALLDDLTTHGLIGV